ncbi:MAG: hypothetical protein WC592_04980 [Candidatus Omnitrophota bacterium]|nr:hypothetical protein [Candidatus Omnitrophota bacterium]
MTFAKLRNEKVSQSLFILFVVGAALFFFLKTRADPDLWGHLKFGQDIYEKGEIPKVDTYSYSAYGAPWINHEWLSELIFYTVYRHTKDTGLVLFKFLSAFLVTWIVYASAKLWTRSAFLRMLFVVTTLSVLTRGFTIRPQIFTNLFLACLIFMIDRLENGLDRKWLIALPVIFLLWPNLHGGFVAGLSILMLYVLVKLFTRKLSAPLAVACAFSVLATLINPYGIRLWRFMISAVTLDRPFITEWQMSELSPQSYGYIIVSMIVLVGLYFAKRRRSAFDLVVLSLAFILAFKHNRHTVLFAILAAVLMPKYFDSFAGEWFGRMENRLSGFFINSILACYAVFFISGVFSNTQVNPLKIEISKDEFPVEAVEFLRANGIKGNIFPWFNWGEMCIRQLGDSNKVFIDGRYETIYNNPFIHLYFGVVEGQIDYNAALPRFPETDIMFLDVNNRIVWKVSFDKSWVLAYASPPAVVFLKDNEKNRHVIEKLRKKKLFYPAMTPPFYFE